MKLRLFMMSDISNIMLCIPLVDKSLQLKLYKIQSILKVHPILKKWFKYSIQEKYLTVGSDSQYISYPVSIGILACKYQMVNFVI